MNLFKIIFLEKNIQVFNNKLMHCIQLGLLSFILPINSISHAENYLSGLAIYQEQKNNYPDWSFLKVPYHLDLYENTSQSFTQFTTISYKLSENFDSKNPTVVYINGGPGGASLDLTFEKAFTNLNFIYFNQRGVAFSKPETEQEYLNADYYSSEQTAQDIKYIVQHLHLSKVTVYGHSYGTVPATIFASRYPELTRSVILEGVILNGSELLWSAPHRLKLINKYLKELKPDLAQLIRKFSDHPESPRYWFSLMAQQAMYQENFKNILNTMLENVLVKQETDSSDENYEKRVIGILQAWFPEKKSNEDYLQYSNKMFNMIACEELSGQSEKAHFKAFLNSAFQLELVTLKNENNCAFIPEQKTYDSQNYPIQAPVYYFQGTEDGATTADFAVRHFKQVPQNKAFLVLAKAQGHLPVLSQLKPYNEETTPLRKETLHLFEAAVKTLDLDLTKINELKNKKEHWVQTQRK